MRRMWVPGYTEWAAASRDALRFSTLHQFLSAPSCRCTTIGIGVPGNLEQRTSKLNSLIETVRGVSNWGVDGLWFLESASMDMSAVVNSRTCTTLLVDMDALSRKELPILSSSPTVRHLFLWGSLIAPDGLEQDAVWREFFDAATLHNKLQTLSVLECDGLLFDDAAERLDVFLRSTTSLTHLELQFSPRTCPADKSEASFRAIVDAVATPRNTSSITSLTITSSISRLPTSISRLPKDPAVRLIGCNLITLSDLSLEGFAISGPDFKDVMKSLETNLHLKRLSLCQTRLDFKEKERNEILGAILDALSTSGLPQLDLWRTKFDGNADIEAQLARNAASYAQVLKTKAKIPATAVRLFLCGDPHAGKTTLLETLMLVNRSPSARLASPASSFVNRAKACFCCCCRPPRAERERTRGIEVHTLTQNAVQVSAWDMAGQDEYHAFHDHIFPNLSVESSPAFFLFVWSPVRETTTGQDDTKSVEDFKTSLSYWLRFIASKTRKSNVLRRLLIVLTRDDKVPCVRANIQPSVIRLMSDFDKIIELVDIYPVDARDPTSVGEVASQIFITAGIVLENIQTYEICNRVRTYFSSLKKSKDANKSPVIEYQDFQDKICKQKFNIIDPDIAKAIAASLNESGDVIYLNRLEFLVSDPHWFCHDIMGELIHSFWGNASHRTMQTVDGFVTEEYIREILEKQERKRGRSIKGAQLVNLMESLHLCCRVSIEQIPSLFIPAALSSSSNPQIALRWRDATIEHSTFVGRRLECERKNVTFLTPGFFPLIQVSFHQAFQEKGAAVLLGKDLITIYHDADDCSVEIIIEFCKVLGYHAIDVMVRSPQKAGEAVCFRTIASVINAITKICADPAGNQGVDLEIGIIRPECLHDPASSQSRENQCVPMKNLKKDLERKLRSGLQLRHTWNTKEDPFLLGENSIKELVGVEEFSKVVGEFQDILKEAAEQLGICVEEASTSKPVVARRLARVETRLVNEAVDRVNRVTGGNVEDMTVASICKDLAILTVKLLSIGYDVQSKVDDLNRKVDDMAANIVELRNKVLPELTLMLLPLVDEKRLPRLCFLTKEGLGVGTRIITTVFKDIHSARLELFCEDRRKPHRIDQQEGISITALEEGVIKQGLPCFRRILQFLSLASNVGAGMAVGAGVSIPNISPLIDCVLHSTDTLDTQRLPIEDGRVKEGLVDFRGWEQWLINVLQRNDRRIAENLETKFKLRRARYKDTPSQVAWLCDEHYALQDPFPFL